MLIIIIIIIILLLLLLLLIIIIITCKGCFAQHDCLPHDIKYLFENSYNDLLNEIFLRTIYNFNEKENPMFAFVQKMNVFYVYELPQV